MKPLKSAVIGGGAGGNLSMDALVASEFFELVAMADIDEAARKKAEKNYPGIKTYESAEALFKDCPIEMACISTFPPSHEEITMAALALPLQGILVEKPLGHTAKSGQRILSAVKAKKIPMAVPHGSLVLETPMKVKELIKTGAIGNLRLVEIEFDKWDIINAGIHWINLFLYFVENEPLDYVMAICEGSTRTYRDGMQVETTAVTYAQTKSGIRLVMNCGDDIPINADSEGPPTLFRLVGSKGIIEFHGWGSGYRILNKEHPDFDFIEVEPLAIKGHRAHLENMYKMIGNEPDYSVAESSLTALEVCEAAYLSSKHQCKVTFPFVDFVLPNQEDWEMGIPYTGTDGGRDGRFL